MKRIAVLTSGGDAPGMNAAIRAVVRTALNHDITVYGIQRGFAGLINDEMAVMTSDKVGDILQRGGTILQSARSPEFCTDDGVAAGAAVLAAREIEGLVVIGGDGSFRGALSLSDKGINVIGLPASIDNDIGGTDYSIGFDTAVNTVLDALNKIRDTASSHARVYVLEVMGRNAGFIALTAAVAGGAEAVMIPERPYDLDATADLLKEGHARGKRHGIVIVAEGLLGDPSPDQVGSSGFLVGRAITARTGFETRITVLGHIQRGGNPSALDRLIATRSGAKAVELLLAGDTRKMVGYIGDRVNVTDLVSSIKEKRRIDDDLLELVRVMATS